MKDLLLGEREKSMRTAAFLAWITGKLVCHTERGNVGGAAGTLGYVLEFYMLRICGL